MKWKPDAIDMMTFGLLMQALFVEEMGLVIIATTGMTVMGTYYPPSAVIPTLAIALIIDFFVIRFALRKYYGVQ